MSVTEPPPVGAQGGPSAASVVTAGVRGDLAAVTIEPAATTSATSRVQHDEVASASTTAGSRLDRLPPGGEG